MTEEKKWLALKDLELNKPVLLEVVKVTPQESDDSRFSMDCKVHSGPLASDDRTVRFWWSRYRKGSRTFRSDFMKICQELLPDKWMVKPIHSFDFQGKVFWSTPKSFFAGKTTMLTAFKEASDEITEKEDVPAESLNETTTF